MSSTMARCLWIQQLSMTITELGAGNGCIVSKRHSMKV
jgi:hypothetical protein